VHWTGLSRSRVRVAATARPTVYLNIAYRLTARKQARFWERPDANHCRRPPAMWYGNVV